MLSNKKTNKQWDEKYPICADCSYGPHCGGLCYNDDGTPKEDKKRRYCSYHTHHKKGTWEFGNVKFYGKDDYLCVKNKDCDEYEMQFPWQQWHGICLDEWEKEK